MSDPAGRLPSPLVAIADHGALGDALLERAQDAARGGVRWLLLRAPRLETKARAEVAVELLRRCPGVFLSVHGDPSAALASGARGVHFPARALAATVPGGPPLLAGTSCHDAHEVARAEAAGVDYAFLSPVFAPTSKPEERPALGIEGFSRLARASRLPLLALGGMRPERVEPLCRAGAAGIAVLGDLFLSDDVAARAEEWARAVRDAYGEV